MLLEINQLDVVRLKDGREGTVLDIYTSPSVAYEIETATEVEGEYEYNLYVAKPEEIEEVIWRSSDPQNRI